jgi:hypothetical protein
MKTISPTTADAVATFLGAPDPARVLSCRDAVMMVRSMVPRCELTDPELADLIVLRAKRKRTSAMNFEVPRLTVQ